MQSAQDNTVMHPHQSVRLSAANAVGVVAVSSKRACWWCSSRIASPLYTILPLYLWCSGDISWCLTPHSVITSASYYLHLLLSSATHEQGWQCCRPMCRLTSTPQLPYGQLQAPSHLGATLTVTSLICLMSLAQCWNRVLALVCENTWGTLLGSVHIHGSIPALSKPPSQRQAIADDSTTGFLQAIQWQCGLQVLRFFRETEWRIGATLRIHQASFSTSLRKVFRGYEGFNFEMVHGEYM